MIIIISWNWWCGARAVGGFGAQVDDDDDDADNDL